MKWETVKLKELCSVLTKGTTPSNIGESFTESGINFIRSELITAKKYISTQGLVYISRETHKKLKRSQLKVGDILFSMAGVYLGKTAILREEDVPANTNQAVAIIRIAEEKCNQEYIYYFLNLPATVKQVNALTGQAAQPNINLSQIGNLFVELPERKVQDKIVAILSAYDDLIENNQKQIKLLEEAAQRLYKEWFIDLHFPRHETTPIVNGIPEGWEWGRADSFFEISIGKTPPRAENQWFTDAQYGVPWASISDMGGCNAFILETAEGLTREAVEKFHVKQVPINTVLLSFKLTVGRVAISSMEMCTNEAIAHFYTNEMQRDYVYLYLKSFQYDTLGSTSSISKAVNSKIIKSMPFVMPDKEILLAFERVVRPYFDMIYNKSIQIKQLKEARDRLLPKLMRGEIEV